MESAPLTVINVKLEHVVIFAGIFKSVCFSPAATSAAGTRARLVRGRRSWRLGPVRSKRRLHNTPVSLVLLKCEPMSVSPKCQSARGMHGHSNKIKQEFGLTDFPKVRETIF